MKDFKKIAILGGGLLGGSLALALAGRMKISLWARRSESVDEARALGIEDATSDLAEALEGADLVILCVPVGAMAGLIDHALEHGLKPGTLVTDVGSVKRLVHQDMAALREWGIPFIGSHPMAGSEKRGVDASRADLFDGAACFLTDDDAVGEPWRSALEKFWTDLKCRVSWISSGDHDKLVARISHFPHLMAAAAAMVSLRNADEAAFGGGGLRDTTRVAGGDPEMWAEIVMENRKAVETSVSESIGVLEEIRAALDAGDHVGIRRWLDQAHQMHSACRKSEASEDSR